MDEGNSKVYRLRTYSPLTTFAGPLGHSNQYLFKASLYETHLSLFTIFFKKQVGYQDSKASTILTSVLSYSKQAQACLSLKSIS